MLRLGVGKLVWIDREGGLLRPDGSRESFVDRAELEALLASGGAGANARRVALLREVEEALDAGIAAVNVCTLEGLADELFTYGGSGTLFTRERYVVVRRLGLDDLRRRRRSDRARRRGGLSRAAAARTRSSAC